MDQRRIKHFIVYFQAQIHSVKVYQALTTQESTTTRSDWWEVWWLGVFLGTTTTKRWEFCILKVAGGGRREGGEEGGWVSKTAKLDFWKADFEIYWTMIGFLGSQP